MSLKMKEGHRRPRVHVSILHEEDPFKMDDAIHQPGTWTTTNTTASTRKMLTCTSDGGRRSYGGFERPVIAVPFNWEAQPGVPKSKSHCPPPTSPEFDSQRRNTKCDAAGGQSPLAPPPRLMRLSSSTRSRLMDGTYHPHHSRNALNSPRSPRSVWLSKKMKSLLQGKLKSSTSSSEQPSPTSPGSFSWGSSEMEGEEHRQSDEYSALQSSAFNDIVFEGDMLRSISVSRNTSRARQSQTVSPFQNMSSMLLELWYGESSSVCSSSLRIPSSTVVAREQPAGYVVISPPTSSSSSDLESPGSSTDNSLNSFSSDSSDQLHQLQLVPRHDHEFKTSFDSMEELEVKLLEAAGCDANSSSKSFQSSRDVEDVVIDYEEEEVGEDYEDFSMEVRYSTSSREFLARKFYYKSDRFRVESSESASLIGNKQADKQAVQPRPSALKKQNSGDSGVSKSLKKVRFAAEEVEVSFQVQNDEQVYNEEEVEQTSSPGLNSPVLTRFSSRPSSRYSGDEDTEAEICSPSPRTRRDLSELLMQIIQADVELFFLSFFPVVAVYVPLSFTLVASLTRASPILKARTSVIIRSHYTRL